MIIVEMSGRMGNQMFRYAFARMLQLKSPEDEELVLDFSNILMEREKGEMPGWEDSLQYLHTAEYSCREGGGNMMVAETGALQKAVLGILKAGDLLLAKKGTNARIAWWKRFQPWLNRHRIYKMFTGYDYPYRWVPGKKLLAAPFECAAYPESIRDVLLREFVPKAPVLEHNARLMELITTTNSVCVSVRRGNYLQYSALDVCGADYYNRAIIRMAQLVEHPVFFLFSDDIEWVRENVTVPGQAYYETGDDPAWEKLRLMYSCRHFVIANSTFSWWAQFLGTFPEKKVIAPSRWFNDEYEPPMAEDGWIRIEV